jgi:hypothetical protein
MTHDHANSATRELRLRSEALQWREVEGEVIALEGRTATYLAANPSGAFLWRALAKGATREQLVAGLADRFAIDRIRAAEDVDSFLQELVDQNLLELEP